MSSSEVQPTALAFIRLLLLGMVGCDAGKCPVVNLRCNHKTTSLLPICGSQLHCLHASGR